MNPDLDRLPCMLLVLDSQGRARDANRAFEHQTGRPASEAHGAGWQAAFDPQAALDLRRQLAGERDFSLPLVMHLAQGHRRRVQCSSRWQPDTAVHFCVLHEEAAAEDAELLRLLLDNLPVLIAYYEVTDYRCRFANRRYAQAFGFDEQSIVGRTTAEVIGQEAADEILPHVLHMREHLVPIAYERQVMQAGSPTRWMDVNMVPHEDADGNAAGAFVLISDITQRRRTEQALRESEDRLAKFMLATAEGILFHKDGLIIDANPSLGQLVGHDAGALRGRHVLEFVAPEQKPQAMAVMAANRDACYESVVVDRAGQHIAVEIIARSMTHNGEHVRMVIVRDIRDRQATQARIRHLAHHDSLTGLPNRLNFLEQLQQRLASARASDTHLAVLFIDLDRFKEVNDTLGHATGDRVLKTVASKLSSALRNTDLVARFGGDEFVVLLHEAAQQADVERIARKLLDNLRVTAGQGKETITVTPSIGIAMRPAHGITADELIRHADMAMYQAKAAGRAGFRLYDPRPPTAEEPR